MKSMRKVLVLITGTALFLAADQAEGCYDVVVGRQASADGAVLLAHNEDSGDRPVLIRQVPRLQHPPGSTVILDNGGVLAEEPETYGYLWTDYPGLHFSDGYLNEWGVCITGLACPAREDAGAIQQDGIGYMLHRLMLQRAASARQAVAVAGELLAQFGYWDNGRTYVVADPREAWLLSVVQGNHWVARRVPDDQVALVPNVYTIGEVDLADSANCLGSPDLVAYAVTRGWHDPAAGQPFRFDRAYGLTSGVDPRQRQGQLLVTGQDPGEPAEGLPFAVRPAHPLTVADVTGIIRDKKLRAAFTSEGRVYQLRDWLPPEIGCVYWSIVTDPRSGVQIPWYLGITETPESYRWPVPLEQELSLDYHFNPPPDLRLPGPRLDYWVFRQLADMTTDGPLLEAVQAAWHEVEAAAYARQPAVEAEAQRLYTLSPDSARAYLTRYSTDQSRAGVQLARYLSQALPVGGPMPDIRLVTQGVTCSAAPQAARAGQATRLSASVVFNTPPEAEATEEELSLDLSALGVPLQIPLARQEEGRYTTTTTVSLAHNDRYPFFFLSRAADGSQRGLGVANLDVYPAADLVIFGDGAATGWSWQAKGKAAIDTAAAPGYGDSLALKVDGSGSLTLQAAAVTPVCRVGYDTLSLAICPGATKPMGLNLGLNARLGVDLLPRLDWQSQRWQRVALPVDSLGLQQPDEEITSISIKGRMTGSLWLSQVSLNTASLPPPTAVEGELAPPRPSRCLLAQNYPNPFNANTVIGFVLPAAESIELTVFNLAGQQVAVLDQGLRQPGVHTIRWDGRNEQGRPLASGIYLYRLSAGASEVTRKLVLLR